MALDNRSPDGAPADHGEARVLRLHDAGPPADGEYSGPEAADLAGISYRQLDYWARRNWVVPSRVDCEGVQRRVYTTADIVRLAALGHLGRSHIDVATYAEATGTLRVSGTMGALVVWGIHDESVRLASPKDLRRVTSQPGRYVIFDPAPVLRRLARRQSGTTEARPKRRTFTAAYKLGVLAEYERLTEPGAKGALLRKEGLHTSHLVAWRRGRETGELAPPARRSTPPRPATASRNFRPGGVAVATVNRPA